MVEMVVAQKTRFEMVKAMNTIIRLMNDESFLDTWLTMGVPDESTDEDIAEYVKSDEFVADYGYAFLQTMLDILQTTKDPIYSLTGIHGDADHWVYDRKNLEFDRDDLD